MPSLINPLRYPGAKRALGGYIGDLITANNLKGCDYYEPYAGSAAVGLDLLQKGVIGNLVLCEKDILLASFWKCVFEDAENLCEKIAETDITIEEWREQSKFRKKANCEEATSLDLGFAALFLNRTCFSGILKANPIGGMSQESKYSIDCRFNKEKVCNIIASLSAYADHVEVHCDDALHFMRGRTKSFLRRTSFAYFDPPYYKKGPSLYRHFYSSEDHIALASFIQEIKMLDWIMSYDDDPFICSLYQGPTIRHKSFYLDYSCAYQSRKQGNEVLISNLPLPPVQIAKVSGM